MTLLVAECLFCIGCGAGMYPVDGIVMFDDGQPAKELAGGFVTFQSQEQNISSQGVILPDGRFTLSTQAESDGAYPGKYRVLVSQPPFRGSERERAPEIIERRYSDPQASPLSATIEASRNHIPLTVTRGKPRRK
jgi:hypothetical protein